MKTPLEILTEARELISKEENWTRGTMARRSDCNIRTSALDPEADCFCSIGAIIRAAFPDISISTEEFWNGNQSDWRFVVPSEGGANTPRPEVLEAIKIVAEAIAVRSSIDPSKPELAGSVVFRFNDRSSHADVLAAFDKALNSMEAS